MQFSSNKLFKNIYKLFDDLEIKFDICIDEFTKRKMLNEICNLVVREAFLLSELETYIIRCYYGIYESAIGSTTSEISIAIGCNESKVKVIYIQSMKKIYDYIRRQNKIREYGTDSIYSLNNIDYDTLEVFEKNKIIYSSDLVNLSNEDIFLLFRKKNMKLFPVFNDDVVYHRTLKDYFMFLENFQRKDISTKPLMLKLNSK